MKSNLTVICSECGKREKIEFESNFMKEFLKKGWVMIFRNNKTYHFCTKICKEEKIKEWRRKVNG